MINDLRDIGLSRNEAEIYICLSKEKNQTASKISKETKINRSVTYFVLQSLMDKGLVNCVTVGGVKRFSSTNPDAIRRFIKNKEELFKNILPKLKALEPTAKNEIKVEVFQSIKGGLVVMEDILKSCNEYVAFGEDPFQKILGTLAEQYIRKMKERGVKERVLVPLGQKVLKGENTSVRYLPKEISLPSLTAVYGNKLAIAIFEQPYYIIVIESKELARTYNSFFELLWKIAKD